MNSATTPWFIAYVENMVGKAPQTASVGSPLANGPVNSGERVSHSGSEAIGLQKKGYAIRQFPFCST